MGTQRSFHCSDPSDRIRTAALGDRVPDRPALRARTLPAFLAVTVATASLFGCASVWHGEIDSRHLTVTGQITETAILAHLTVQQPTVVDRDGDFREVAGQFLFAVQDVELRYVWEKRMFSDCSKDAVAAGYVLATQITVDNYRPPAGFAVTLLGGFLPPVIGLVWSMPVGEGNLEGEMVWTLRDPTGGLVATRTARFDLPLARFGYDGFRWFTVAPAFDDLLRMAASKIRRAPSPG
jgi:hypothetical protein